MRSSNQRRRINGKRKGQIWISDYTISLLLFIVAALLATKIIVNNFTSTSEFKEIKDDTARISDMMLSEGYPSDWHNASVMRIGLMTGERLDPSKIINAMNLSNNSYSSVRTKLQTRNDFIVVFQDNNNQFINFSGSFGIGSPEVAVNSTAISFSEDYNNLVKLTRFAVLDSRIVRMIIFVWK